MDSVLAGPLDNSLKAPASLGGEDWVVSPDPGELSGFGKMLIVSVPKSQERGIYSLKVSIVDSAGGTVAEETYNVIVK